VITRNGRISVVRFAATVNDFPINEEASSGSRMPRVQR